MGVDGIGQRIKNPAYTGENRCGACTTLNLIVATVVSIIIATQSLPVGIAIFFVSLVAIYLWGYLIPGTPTLTRRYVPKRLLELFHGEQGHPDEELDQQVDGVDGPYEYLSTIDLLEPCPNANGVSLVDEVRTRWEEQSRANRTKQLAEAIADTGDHQAVELHVETDTDVTVQLDGLRVGHWQSLAILFADLASWAVLARRAPNWESIPADDKRRIIGAMRIFVTRCPACDEPVDKVEEAVDSCCMSTLSRTTVRGRCPACETTFYEVVEAADLPLGRRRTHGAGVTMTFPLRSP